MTWLFIPYIFNGVVRISFAEIINLPSLVRFLNMENGVILATRVVIYGYANNVTYEKEGDNQYVNFQLGWDDCLSGCQSNRKWKFVVNIQDCSVEYLGASGNPVTFWLNEPPAVLNCNLSVSTDRPFSFENINLYPNPVKGILNIEADNLMQSIEIYDLLGRVVFHQTLNDRFSHLDLSFLSLGVYYAKINNQYIKQFVKE